MIRALQHAHWNFMRTLPFDEAISEFISFVLKTSERFIPRRVIREHRRSHPWMTQRGVDALARKAAAQHSSNFHEIAMECGEVIRDELATHVAKTKSKLSSLKGSVSRRWWRLSHDFLRRVAPHSGIPALKDASGAWVTDAKGKAKRFASSFAAEFTPPDDVEDIEALDPADHMSDFHVIRLRTVVRVLRALLVDQSTGPDHLGALVLVKCASVLALPVAIISRRCISEGRWPHSWKLHWLSPLYKKKEVFNANNYRGLHPWQC